MSALSATADQVVRQRKRREGPEAEIACAKNVVQRLTII